MGDLLVRLYDLPDLDPVLRRTRANGFEVRRALAPEKHLVVRWIEKVFSSAWASECEIAFHRQPVACFLAIRKERLCGFAAYETTCRNFFGPIGVEKEFRGNGAGEALLLAATHAMRNEGYAYAIIGGVGPVEFFQRSVGATIISGSDPGVYCGILRNQEGDARRPKRKINESPPSSAPPG